MACTGCGVVAYRHIIIFACVALVLPVAQAQSDCSVSDNVVPRSTGLILGVITLSTQISDAQSGCVLVATSSCSFTQCLQHSDELLYILQAVCQQHVRLLVRSD